MVARLRAVAATLCFLAACAGSISSSPARDAIEPADLYPLQPGNAWSYDVDTGEASTTLAVVRVERLEGGIAEVRTGKAVVRYEVLAEGIRVLPDDRWLIRGPLEEGASWPGRGGRTAKLIALHVTVDTPAGNFDRCIEVLETGGELDLEIRTTYCPDVGPVLVGSTMHSKVSDRTVTVFARLRGYDVTSSSTRDR